MNNRPIVLLTRDDLIHGEQDTPLNEIRHYHFRSTSMTTQDFEGADMVIFEDVNGEYKYLKNCRNTGLTVINTETGKTRVFL